MPVEIKMLVNSCTECPFAVFRKVYTSDSWDNVQAINCKALNNKEVHGFLEWHDEAKIPHYCPFKKGEKSNEKTCKNRPKSSI